jgi:hypothetical protein
VAAAGSRGQLGSVSRSAHGRVDSDKRAPPLGMSVRAQSVSRTLCAHSPASPFLPLLEEKFQNLALNPRVSLELTLNS